MKEYSKKLPLSRLLEKIILHLDCITVKSTMKICLLAPGNSLLCMGAGGGRRLHHPTVSPKKHSKLGPRVRSRGPGVVAAYSYS